MKKPTRIFHWVPRILCILAILFTSMFALDAFAPGLTVWQQIGAFLIHLVPTYILTAFPFLLAGILFLLSRNMKKKEHLTNHVV